MEHFLRTHERTKPTNQWLSGIPNSRIFRASPTGLSPTKRTEVSSSEMLDRSKQTGEGRRRVRKQRGRGRFKTAVMPRVYM